MKKFHNITDPVTGEIEFMRGHDCTDRPAINPLCKLVSCCWQLAYGFCGDAAQDYTGVGTMTANKILYALCNWLDTYHGPIHQGAWAEEAVRKEMDINASRGFVGMLGSIDYTHCCGRIVRWYGMGNFTTGLASSQ